MRINPISNQAFTGRYYYKFDSASKQLKFWKQMEKENVYVDDHAIISDPRFNDLLLLTGQDYQDYKLMLNFLKDKNPVMDKEIYKEELFRTFSTNADVVDLKDYEFIAQI